jgi:ubiquinone/menaquinone biosynthesis C-methylase UbiE
MREAQRAYLPAAGHDWALPLYDPFVKLLGGDKARRALVDQAPLRPGHRVLDVGCGTGTLVVLMKRLHPDIDVVGLDPDPKALARGRRKAERAGLSIHFDRGFADELPYPDASFDRVFSSFMFHHLESGEKEKTLSEIRRVLKPGGSLHLLDFGGPNSGSQGSLARRLHSSHRLKHNFGGRIPTLMSQAGFRDPTEVSHQAMLFGRLSIAYYQGSVPTSPRRIVFLSSSPEEAGARRDRIDGAVSPGHGAGRE